MLSMLFWESGDSLLIFPNILLQSNHCFDSGFFIINSKLVKKFY